MSSQRTHTAIATTAKGEFDAIQVPTRSPKTGEVLIKNEYAAVIAFDTYIVDRGFYVPSYPMALGRNAAGIVAEVGPGVDLKIGDRVAAMAFGESENKAAQEYTILSKYLVGKVPDSVSLVDAVSIPDAFVTAFYTLFNQLGLTSPESFPATTPSPLATTPILIYGGGSSSGMFAIQLLHLAGYKRILTTASQRNHDYLRSIGATDTFDYHSPDVVEEISNAVGGDRKVLLAVDCIAAESTSLKVLGKVISPKGKLAILLPIKEGGAVTNSVDQEMYMEIREDKTPLPKGTEAILVRTFTYQQDEKLRDTLMPQIFPKLLESGALKPNRVRLLDQGSFKDRVATGLQLLRENKISREKVVVKVST